MKKWYKESVIYQIYPKTFKDGNNDGVGDLIGIIQEIPYLKSLGIKAIWLSPIYPSPMNDNGYDISDYRDINPMFGTMDDFKELITKLHQNNIKLIMDLVVNHTSNEHYWFKEALKDKKSKYHNYYFFQDQPNNWTSFFGGSAWHYNPITNEYYLHLFDQSQPDLNWDNVEVRKEIKDILRFWLDLGVDGFRCDVINLISKRKGLPDGNPDYGFIGIEHYANGPKLHEYLKELYDEVFSLYDCFTIGECGIQSIKDVIELTTNELDMVFNFSHFSLDGKDTKWNIQPIDYNDFKKTFYQAQEYFNTYGIWNNLVIENHDQPRSLSRYGDINYPYLTASLTAGFVFLMQGLPFIYQGQEIGMTNYVFKDIIEFQDVESLNFYKEHDDGTNQQTLINILNYISRDHARTTMQWNDSSNGGFTKGNTKLLVNPNYLSINVEQDLKKENSLIRFYQALIKLKTENETFIYGNFQAYDIDNKDIFIYSRSLNNSLYFVVGNHTNKIKDIKLPFDQTTSKVILSNYLENLEHFLPYQIKVYKIE